MDRLRVICPPGPRFEGSTVSSVSNITTKHVYMATEVRLLDDLASNE